MSSSDKLYDLIIVGGGPAGLSAAIYAAREKSNVLLIEKGFYGGQIALTSEVENYPGVISTSGPELSETMRKQAELFGCSFEVLEVTGITCNDDDPIKLVHTSQGTFRTLALLMTTGAYPRPAGFEGEETFKGRGVSYCATCDGMFYTNKEVYVIGGGFAACEEAVYLTRFASKVTMLIRRDEFSAPLSIVQQVLDNDKIEVRFETQITKVEGNFAPEKIHFIDTKRNEVYVEEKDPGSFGIFVFTGYIPETTLIREYADCDEQGGVITDKNMATKTAGLYAAGDIRGKSLRQLVTAASDGAIAATAIGRMISDFKYEHPEYVSQ